MSFSSELFEEPQETKSVNSSADGEAAKGSIAENNSVFEVYGQGSSVSNFRKLAQLDDISTLSSIAILGTGAETGSTLTGIEDDPTDPKAASKTGDIPDAPPLEDSSDNNSMLHPPSTAESIKENAKWVLEKGAQIVAGTAVTILGVTIAGRAINRFIINPVKDGYRRRFWASDPEKVKAKKDAIEKADGEENPGAQYKRFRSELDAEHRKRIKGIDGLTRTEDLRIRFDIYSDLSTKWKPRMAHATMIIADRNQDDFLNPPISDEQKEKIDKLDTAIENQEKGAKDLADVGRRLKEANSRLKVHESMIDDLRSEPGLRTAQDYLDAVNEKIKNNNDLAGSLRDPKRGGVAKGDQADYDALKAKNRALETAKGYFDRKVTRNPTSLVTDAELEEFLNSCGEVRDKMEIEFQSKKTALEKLGEHIVKLQKEADRLPGTETHGSREDHAHESDAGRGSETMVEINAGGTLKFSGGRTFAGTIAEEYRRAKAADYEERIELAEDRGDIAAADALRGEREKVLKESPTRLGERLAREIKAHPEYARGTREFKMKDITKGFAFGIGLGGAVLLDAVLGDDPN